MSTPIPPTFHMGPHGLRLATRFLPARDPAHALAHTLVHSGAPALVFLPGYMSDMTGTKAEALFDWAARQGHACLLMDYSGCGQSEGDFADGTLALARRGRRDDPRPQSGQSRAGRVEHGGWLMLLVARALGRQAAGLVGLAAAPDFTDWGFTEQEKAALASGQTHYEESPYGPEPTPTHAAFWADGEALHQLDTEVHGPIPFDGPAILIHGQADEVVPWGLSLRLAEALRSAMVQVHLIKDGDHRLSRPQDIAVLLDTLARLLAHP
jgi:pimeloyl-ACP methyl ester carboxylesterase